MSIDDKVGIRTYRNLNPREVCSFNLEEGGNNLWGSRRGSFNFYEGVLDHDIYRVLFFLQKEVDSDETFDFVSRVYDSLLSASIFLETSRCQFLDERQKRETYESGKRLLEVLSIPKESWPNRGGHIDQALHDVFSSDAHITVPGLFVNFLGAPSEKMLSQVKLIPDSWKDHVTAEFRERGYGGPISFW